MPTRSQIEAMLREAARRQKQAIDDYNRKVQTHNRQVDAQRREQQRAVDNYNREVQRRNQQLVQAVHQHNRQISTYNSRVRSHQLRVESELRRLAQRPVTTRYEVLRVGTAELDESYHLLDRTWEADLRNNRDGPEILDLSQREVANDASVLNRLLDSADSEVTPPSDEEGLGDKLRQISPDLDSRWAGAVFALNPQNPDAARHFCTSSREIIATILELRAPDAAVRARFPECEVTQQGTPTRRSKIKFMLAENELSSTALENFVHRDIDNVVELFGLFNSGTHGSAGSFTHIQLQAIRTRVEDAIHFLARINGLH